MTTENSHADPDTFTSKLDIAMVSTGMFRKLIDVFAGSRIVLAAMGPSGIGKTAIPQQAAKERDAVYVALHMPTMSIEDFHIPTPAKDSKLYYDRRIPRKFQPLFNYVEKLTKENGGVFPKGRNPILALEELNRAPDKHVTRAVFTLLDDRVIGDTVLPDEVQMVVTMNPSGNGMMVNEFEKDPAMRRRLTIMGVTASYGDFIRHARGKFHEKVVEHLEAQPTLIYDTQGPSAGRTFACPATWDTVSKLCFAFDAVNIPLVSQEARAAFSGAIGAASTEIFMEFVKDASIVITPEEVLGGYRKGAPVQDRFKKLVTDSRQDKITSLVTSLTMYLFADTKRQPTAFAKQLGAFMEDLPEENTIVFIRELTAQAKSTTDGQKYLVNLSRVLAGVPAYTAAVERMQQAQKKGEKEAAK